MKNVFLALIALVSIQSFATSPVQPQENSIAELRMFGGMPVPGGVRFRHLWIKNSGEVMVNESYYGKNPDDLFEGGIEREYLLGSVTDDQLTELTDAVDAIEGGGLTKPSGPQCMDAPSYFYGVAKYGMILNTFSRTGCRDAQLKDRSQRRAAAIVRAYLDAWNKATL